MRRHPIGNVNASRLARIRLAKAVPDAGRSAFQTMLQYIALTPAYGLNKSMKPAQPRPVHAAQAARDRKVSQVWESGTGDVEFAVQNATAMSAQQRTSSTRDALPRRTRGTGTSPTLSRPGGPTDRRDPRASVPFRKGSTPGTICRMQVLATVSSRWPITSRKYPTERSLLDSVAARAENCNSVPMRRGRRPPSLAPSAGVFNDDVKKKMALSKMQWVMRLTRHAD